MPLAKVDVDAGVKAKFNDLVNDASEDAEKWKHKVTGMEERWKEALKEKKVAEEKAKDTKAGAQSHFFEKGFIQGEGG